MRHQGPVLRRADGWCVEVVQHATAAEMVRRLHYSRGSANTSIVCLGLVDPSGHLAGVTMWMPPTPGAARWAMSTYGRRAAVLSRMAIEEGVPRNGASFLLSRCPAVLLSRGWEMGITYADPMEGHTGAIYLAAGWTRAGETAPRRRWTDTDGVMRSLKCGDENVTVASATARGWTSEKCGAKARFVKMFGAP